MGVGKVSNQGPSVSFNHSVYSFNMTSKPFAANVQEVITITDITTQILSKSYERTH